MKKFLSLVMCLLMALSVIPMINLSASAAGLTSGSCGYDVSYSFNSATGTLTISGTGDMATYNSTTSPFYYNSNIRTVVINNGVTKISDWAFNSCQSLTSVILPNSLEKIGRCAFSDCESLISITIPDSVTYIGSGAFEYCESLTSITIPSGVTSIPDRAFFNCTSLKSIEFPNNLELIKSQAFNYCKSLKSVTIPASVSELDGFCMCESLTSITILGLGTKLSINVFSTDMNNYSYDCRNLTIKAYTGSLAEKFAQSHRINFVALDAPKHTHSYISTVTKKATCTSTGIKTYTCSCGDKKTEIIAKTAHTNKWVVTKKATYFATGTRVNKCSVCGKVSKTETIAILKLKKPTVKITAGSKKFSVKYTKVKDATGFQVKYTIGGKTKNLTFKTAKSATKVITKLKKGNCKVQVRSYVQSGSKKAYSSWTKAKIISVK